MFSPYVCSRTTKSSLKLSIREAVSPPLVAAGHLPEVAVRV
jgi:hypothetical protein